MLTPEEASALRGLLAREAPAAATKENTAIAAGDVAQIRPEADPTFGGMLAVITQTDHYQLRGYLLRPHRGGCREAWLRWKPNDLVRLGKMHWDQLPEFARRSGCDAPACPASEQQITRMLKRQRQLRRRIPRE